MSSSDAYSSAVSISVIPGKGLYAALLLQRPEDICPFKARGPLTEVGNDSAIAEL